MIDLATNAQIHRLPENWSFLTIGSLKAASANVDALVLAGITHVVNAGAFKYDRHSQITYLDLPVVVLTAWKLHSSVKLFRSDTGC